MLAFDYGLHYHHAHLKKKKTSCKTKFKKGSWTKISNDSRHSHPRPPKEQSTTKYKKKGHYWHMKRSLCKALESLCVHANEEKCTSLSFPSFVQWKFHWLSLSNFPRIYFFSSPCIYESRLNPWTLNYTIIKYQIKSMIKILIRCNSPQLPVK